MNSVDYYGKHYKSSAICGVDELTVSKSSCSDWSTVSMQVHDQTPTEICIRSKEHAEHLHFMLGQMLELK